MSKGVGMSVAASVLFAVMYFYTSLLTPLTGEEIFGWRMLLTFPFVLVFMAVSGDWRLARVIGLRVMQRPALLLAMALTSFLLGMQLWLFMWAPLHGRAMQVSLGYFLLPLTMLLTGRLLYRERLTRLQGLAAACAAAGVGHELVRVGGFSWEALVVALGYPLYFIVRRRCALDNLGGALFDMALMLPVALWFVMEGGQPLATLATRPALYGMIPLLGLFSGAALVCYLLASRLLPFSLFGLLGYLEPVLLVVVALLLGETISASEWYTYLPIWLAVGLLVLEGARSVLGRRVAR